MGDNKKLLIPYSLNIKQNDAEMSLSDHIEELRQRAFWSVAVLLSSILISVFSVKSIVKILQEPALGIKFLQFAPGEYFFASIKVASYTGLLVSGPFLIYQIMLFVLPGMTKDERKTILPIIFGALTLFLSNSSISCSVTFPFLPFNLTTLALTRLI